MLPVVVQSTATFYVRAKDHVIILNYVPPLHYVPVPLLNFSFDSSQVAKFSYLKEFLKVKYFFVCKAFGVRILTKFRSTGIRSYFKGL